MAELLIKAEEPWKITEEGSRKGDVIVVRPDGWEWGKEECLPRFVVVKVPGSEKDNKYLEAPIMEEMKDKQTDKISSKMKRYRENSITALEVDDIKEEVKDFEKITAVSLKAEIKKKVVEKSKEGKNG